MKKFTFLFIVMTVAQYLVAQQLPLFTQYREHQSYTNPAFVDSDYLLYSYNVNISATYRLQGIGAGLGPSTQVLNMSWLTTKSTNFNWNVGGIVLNDEFEPTNFTAFSAKIAGVLNTNGNNPQDGGLSVGLTLGAIQHRIVGNIRFLEKEEAFSNNVNINKVIPDMGVGLFFYHRFQQGKLDGDLFYTGFSIPQILEGNLALDTQQNISFQRRKHFFASLGYYKRLNDLSFLELSFWGRYVNGIPFDIDSNLRWQYQNIFWLGTGASSNNFHLEAGFLVGDNLGWKNTVKIGYGFSYGFANNLSLFGTTHEINVKVLGDW